MSRSWIPPPHSLVHSVQVDHGLILHPKERKREAIIRLIWTNYLYSVLLYSVVLNAIRAETNLDALRSLHLCHHHCCRCWCLVPWVVSSHYLWHVFGCTFWSCTSFSGCFQDRGRLQTEAPASPCVFGLYDLCHRTYYTLTTRSTQTSHSLWLRRQNWKDFFRGCCDSRKLLWEF